MIPFSFYINHFQKLLIVHLLICDILAIIKQGIRRDRSWCILRFLHARESYGLEINPVLLSGFLQNQHILCIEGTLVCIVKDISILIDMRMLCAIFEHRCFNSLFKRQIP